MTFIIVFKSLLHRSPAVQDLGLNSQHCAEEQCGLRFRTQVTNLDEKDSHLLTAARTKLGTTIMHKKVLNCNAALICDWLLNTCLQIIARHCLHKILLTYNILIFLGSADGMFT